jgi:hypothetical protein
MYVMDNHLAAYYCWTKELDYLAKYSLLHIDQHHDLSDALVQMGFHQHKDVNFKSFDLDQYLSLRTNNCQLLQWDNYVELYNAFFPLNIISYEFITPQKLPQRYRVHGQTTLKRWIKKRLTIHELVEAQPSRKPSKIINLDLDIFYDKKFKYLLTDEELDNFCEKLKVIIATAKVITIALSPELCGGWAESLRMYDVINEKLGLDFKLDI